MRACLAGHPRVRLEAAADPRVEARAAFEAEFGGRTYETVDAMCGDPQIDVVYVASPHELHATHAIAAAGAGKHVLVEKPMALSLADCAGMTAAARDAGVQLIVGPSHSFDAPVARTRALIAAGEYGLVRQIVALTYTDFLYRPRRPEELEEASGGGVLFSQAVHQIDTVRLLAGGLVRSVRAHAGAWDPERPSDGAYTALLRFEGGAAASLSYSGYGRYDSDELVGWIGETGFAKDPGVYGDARKRLDTGGANETRLKEARAYGAPGSSDAPEVPPHHEHFGYLLVSCERADLRPTPHGVTVYGERERIFHPLDPPRVAREAVIDEVWRAVGEAQQPLHSGEWGAASLEVCLAMKRSAEEDREVSLEHQIAVVDGPSG